jgi:hypothetical protein
MSNIITLPSIRVRGDNPNHHLWNNNGTWFLHYTVYPTPFTKERIRRSLGTKSLETARQRRDAFFAQLAADSAVSAPASKVAVVA